MCQLPASTEEGARFERVFLSTSLDYSNCGRQCVGRLSVCVVVRIAALGASGDRESCGLASLPGNLF